MHRTTIQEKQATEKQAFLSCFIFISFCSQELKAKKARPLLERQLRLRDMLEREEDQYAVELDRIAESASSDRVGQMRERARALRENREVSHFTFFCYFNLPRVSF